MPVFRARRLNEGDKFRVHPHGKASLTLADRSRFIFSADPRPTVVEVETYQLKVDHRRVFDFRSKRVMHDIEQSLGLGRARFEPAGNAQPIGARG
jgi:hypothetical protein